MKRFLKTKDKYAKMWTSITKRPHFHARQVVRDASANLMGQEEVHHAPPTLMDEKRCMQMTLCFPKGSLISLQSLFEHIKLCKSIKDIWDTLKYLFEGLENVKDKRLT